MKKLILVAVIAFILPLGLKAKTNPVFNYGVKAGIMNCSATLPDISVSDYKLSTDSNLGYQMGLMARLSVLSFHVQAELLYSLSRYKMNMHNLDELATPTVRVNTLDVPVLVGYHIAFFSIQAGPVFNIATNSKVVKSDDLVKNILTTKPLIGYSASVAAEFSHIIVDVRYTGGFKKSSQALTVASETKEYKFSQSQWMFSVGYLF